MKEDLKKKDVIDFERLEGLLGEDFFTALLGDTKERFNVFEELLLGNDVENPHMVNWALDRQPAIKTYWSTLLLRAKEELSVAKEQFEVVRAEARDFVRDFLSSLESKCTKDDIDMKLKTMFDAYIGDEFSGSASSLELAKKFGLSKSSGKIYKGKLIEYVKAKKFLKRKERNVNVLSIVVEAWQSRGYNLKSIADLIGDMMQSQVLLVKDVRVVESNGKLRKAKKGKLKN
ncbi:MAG: hypothetical protein GF317_04975 [Candidatus Lokiarchaeota archaeon]|nr:hypothetical protein [Candidatus Lokiarchaeota archaeon]